MVGCEISTANQNPTNKWPTQRAKQSTTSGSALTSKTRFYNYQPLAKYTWALSKKERENHSICKICYNKLENFEKLKFQNISIFEIF